MKLIYRPDGADTPREWEFKPSKLLNAEAEAIEDRTGWTFEEFGDALMRGSTKARHALLWVMLKRENHRLKYDDVQFAMDEVDLGFTVEERGNLIAALEKASAEEGGLDPKAEEVLAALRQADAEEGIDRTPKPDEESPDPTEPSETVEAPAEPSGESSMSST